MDEYWKYVTQARSHIPVIQSQHSEGRSKALNKYEFQSQFGLDSKFQSSLSLEWDPKNQDRI